MPARDDSTDDHDAFATMLLRTVERPPIVRVEMGAITHVGKVRQNNEDNFLVARLAKALKICATSLPMDADDEDVTSELGYLMVVADGMGGANAGERASALAIEKIMEFILHAINWFQHQQGEGSKIAADLKAALKRADRKISEEARDDVRLTGMGTTVTLAFSVGTALYIVHAGDSRAYLYRDGKIRRLTKDDNMAQLLVDTGALKPEDAIRSPKRNIITNVAGGPSQGVKPHIIREDLKDRDVLVLCTDGLYEPLPEEDASIAEVLRGMPQAQVAAEKLAELALKGRARDNLTCIVARYEIEFLPSSMRSTFF